MKKTMMALLALAILNGMGFNGMANAFDEDCHKRLTKDFTQQSQAIFVPKELWFSTRSGETNALDYLDAALKIVGCEPGEIISPKKIKRIKHDIYRVEIRHLGYFYIVKDMGDTANVVYNNWD